MDAVADVGFIFQDAFNLRDRSHVSFFLRGIFVNIRNICEQIRGSIIALDIKWVGKPVEFQMENEEDVFTVGNEYLLKQVWLNLLDNAIKFSPENALIKITVGQNAEGVEVAISNQGNILSPETCCHIFDRFYQGDTSHTEEGNGLGLTIAKKIVELHNGEIFVDCLEEGWVTFRVFMKRNE